MTTSFILLMTLTVFGKTETMFLPAAPKNSYVEALSSCDELKDNVKGILGEMNPYAKQFITLDKLECTRDAASRMTELSEQVNEMRKAK